MAAHSSILAWKIPRAEEPGRLQPMESQSQTQLSMCTLYEVNTLFYILLLCNNIITSKCYFLSFYNHFLIVACMRCKHRIYHHVCMVCVYIYIYIYIYTVVITSFFRSKQPPKQNTHKIKTNKTQNITVCFPYEVSLFM